MNFTVAQDTLWNKYMWPASQNLYIPVDRKLDSLNPNVSIDDGVFEELVRASKENNQNRINEILSRYL